MENTMGNDMDSTNPTTGFSFINDSLFIDNSSLIHLVFIKPGRLSLKLVRPGKLQSLRLCRFCGCRRIPIRFHTFFGKQAYLLMSVTGWLPGL